METAAIFDPSRRYRYSLRRSWAGNSRWEGAGNQLAFVLLNPSRADEYCNDPTIRRCIGLAKGWGYDGIVVVNLFACRNKDPSVLKRIRSPIGPENDHHIRLCVQGAAKIVVGWGNHGRHRDRGQEVLKLLAPFELWCLGTTKSGQPKHPLYVRQEIQLIRFFQAPVAVTD
jgi:hypothetical protein